MATYRDVALLNDSLGDLNRALTERNLLRERRAERGEDIALRRELLQHQLSREQRAEQRDADGTFAFEFEDENGVRGTYRGPRQAFETMRAQSPNSFKPVSGTPRAEPMAAKVKVQNAQGIDVELDFTQAQVQDGTMGRVLERMGAKARPQASKLPQEWNRDPDKEYISAGGAHIGRDRGLPEPKITRDDTGRETISGTASAVERYEARKRAASATPPEEPAAPGALQVGGMRIGNPSGRTGTEQAPAAVNNQADYDALPSGAVYRHPDGSIRRKK